jgi:hypothetical protein
MQKASIGVRNSDRSTKGLFIKPDLSISNVDDAFLEGKHFGFYWANRGKKLMFASSYILPMRHYQRVSIYLLGHFGCPSLISKSHFHLITAFKLYILMEPVLFLF